MTSIHKLTCQSFCKIHFCQLVLFKFGVFVQLIAFEKMLYIIRSLTPKCRGLRNLRPEGPRL